VVLSQLTPSSSTHVVGDGFSPSLLSLGMLQVYKLVRLKHFPLNTNVLLFSPSGHPWNAFFLAYSMAR
jgi:hypothetical protein